MNLHELVFIKNSLRSSINLDPIKSAVEENKVKLNKILPFSNSVYSQKIQDLINDHDKIYLSAVEEVNRVNLLIEEIDRDINNLTKKFFNDSYQNECYARDLNFIRNVKQIVLADGSYDVLLNRIHFYNSWKYPALELGCRDGAWTKHLIGFDPLYIADDFDEFLTGAASQFTPEYQNRLCRYKIKDFDVSGLPTNQFGFIFSFNYFNYLTLDTIKQYLIKAMEWLRPGGTIMFTYNNADLSASAGLTEGYFMTYVPNSMLVPLAESLGFSVTKSYDFLPSTSWIELQKPGVLSTVKAHQALGEIKYY